MASEQMYYVADRIVWKNALWPGVFAMGLLSIIETCQCPFTPTPFLSLKSACEQYSQIILL